MFVFVWLMFWLCCVSMLKIVSWFVSFLGFGIWFVLWFMVILFF